MANKGVTLHSFYTMKCDVEIGDMFEEEDISNWYWDVVVQPDNMATINFTTPDKNLPIRLGPV